MKTVGRALDEMSHGQQPVHESPAVAAEGRASEPCAGDSTTTDTAPASDARRKRYGRATVSIIPLILMVFWVWQAGVTAIQRGASGIAEIASGTLSYCTTPVSLIVLSALAIWFGVRLRKALAHRKTEFAVGVFLIVVPVWFCLSWVGVSVGLFVRNHPQSTSPAGFNPHALDGWEVTKRDEQSGDAADGLSSAQKKRLREMLGLQLKSNLATLPNINVNLEGADHNVLVVSFGNTTPSVAKLAEALKEQEPDFWNQMRFFNFSEIVLAGPGQYESIPASKFIQWTRGYDAYVSSMQAVYKSQLFGDRGAQENPTVQRDMRQRFASTLDGGLKSLYAAIQVRSEGNNDDKLLMHLPQMNAEIAEDLIRSTRKDGNFWNGVRALGFSEVVMSGNSYQRSISQKEFIPWCRNYEKYLEEVQRAKGQMSSGLEHEPTQPAP